MHIMTFSGQFEPLAQNVSECTAFSVYGPGGNQHHWNSRIGCPMLNMLSYKKTKYTDVLLNTFKNIHSKWAERAEIELKSNRMTSHPLVLAKSMIIKTQESQLCYCWHGLRTAEVMDGSGKSPGSWSCLLNSFTTSLRSIYGDFECQ